MTLWRHTPLRPIVRSAFTLLILAILLSIAGCGQPATPAMSAPAAATLSGTVRISGAFALYPMMVRWAEEFQKINPDVRVDISAGGAGKGMADAVSELVDLGMVSREVKPEEIQQGAVFVPVVKDTVMAIVNANNPVVTQGLLDKGLKKQAFIDLWMQGAQVTWGQAAGAQSSEPVQVYTRSDACGAAETWAKYLGGKQEDLKGTGVYGDPGIADAIKQDTQGIGYSNLNYAFDMTTDKAVAGLAIVPIDVNENGKIDPEEQVDTKAKTVKAIIAGAYPSPPSRDLYLVTKTEFKGLTSEFVRWILTDGQKYVGEAGYVKLADAQLADALATLRKP
jgi:phosphate transport system substrate-binding protein